MNDKPDILETAYLIPDLCCATEEQLIRKGLRNQVGVRELEFNIISHKLRVKHTCREEAISHQLKQIGLPGIREQSEDHTQGGLHRRLLISTGLAGAFLGLGFCSRLFAFPESLTVSFYLGSVLAGGWHIAIKAWKSVRLLSLDMNFLMTIAALGAIAIGQYAESGAVILLFSASLLLESFSLARTRGAIRSLLGLSPPSAVVLHDGNQTTTPVQDVRVGETVVIKPGERIPLDGEVVTGQSSVNEAPITGESLPVLKQVGENVFAGSFNLLGSLEVRVLKSAPDSMISRIIHLIEEAQSRKAPSQTFVERFARFYTPAVFGLAIAVSIVPPLVAGAPFELWFYRALVLLVISCPCALVISTPVTIVSALTNAARAGILIKGGKHLETLATVRSVAFDKTGTLTAGTQSVTDIVPMNNLPVREILRITAAAEIRSEHRLADALLRKAAEESLAVSQLATEDFSAITGRGIRTKVDGKTYIVGNHQLVEEMGLCSRAVEDLLEKFEREGKSVVILSDSSQVLGIIAIADRVRGESRNAIRALRGLGVHRVALLTGDNRGTAASVGTELGLDEIEAELLPENKLAAIESLRKRYGSVAMVGDGINDAPALAAADVGIAMGGTGSDTALETADIALMTDNLTRIPYAIDLAHRALRIIKQNVALALLTKGVFIMLGIFGLSSLWLAILADDGAALIVILNGLRLLKFRPPT